MANVPMIFVTQRVRVVNLPPMLVLNPVMPSAGSLSFPSQSALLRIIPWRWKLISPLLALLLLLVIQTVQHRLVEALVRLKLQHLPPMVSHHHLLHQCPRAYQLVYLLVFRLVQQVSEVLSRWARNDWSTYCGKSSTLKGIEENVRKNGEFLR